MLLAAVSIFLLLACASRVVVDLFGVRMMRTLPLLERLAPAAPRKWPRVSVIVAACDEGDTLRAAMAARLADDYPDVEWILVDDRSTDATGAIVDELAARDPRVRPIHVRELPAGWLGKVHAMQRGLERASGEWILFSDADVHFAVGTIRRAVAWCEGRGLDFLAVVPGLASHSIALDVLFTSIMRATAAAYQVRTVEDPRSSLAVGGGSFNLVRRAALDRTEGLSRLRLEVADDAALAQQVKRAGGRASVAGGQGMVEVAWYRSVREMMVGLEKASFSLMGGYRLSRHLVICALLALQAAAPLLAAAGLGWSWLRAVGAATVVLDVGVAAAVCRFWRRSWIPALLVEPGDVVSAFFMARAGVVAVRRGGVQWRGTLYPLDELRRGRRFSFM
jgi:hypothetical protein